MDYDVLILGGGIIGCAIAYEISKYNLNIALIEKDYDVANDLSSTNSAVVYDGSETYDSVMASMEKMGMNLIKKHCQKFNIEYNKVGALRISSNETRYDKFEEMYEHAKERGIDGVYLLESDSIYDIEPNLSVSVSKALYSENVALISPYNLAISFAEVATDNGVNFRLEEEVIDIKSISKGFKVTTNKNKFTCKFVINTIPNDISTDKQSEIRDKQMRYTSSNGKLNNTINGIVIDDIDDDNFIISISKLSKENLISIKSKSNLNLENELGISKDILEDNSKESITNIKEKNNLRKTFIDESNLNSGYIKVIGNDYSKITIASVIALDIEDKLKTNMNLTKKKDYIDKKREVYVFKNMSKEQRNKLIALDGRYGNIICSCNNISEGEIVDAIRRPLGARTLEGVKRRTGIGLGSCNGSYCNMKIIKILAREMNKSVLNIVDESMDSNVLIGRIKEFDEI